MNEEDTDKIFPDYTIDLGDHWGEPLVVLIKGGRTQAYVWLVCPTNLDRPRAVGVVLRQGFESRVSWMTDPPACAKMIDAVLVAPATPAWILCQKT